MCFISNIFYILKFNFNTIHLVSEPLKNSQKVNAIIGLKSMKKNQLKHSRAF